MRARLHVSHLLFGFLAALIAAAAPLLLRAAETAFAVTLDASQAQPRHVEETTVASLQRDYGHAWRSMAAALEENKARFARRRFRGRG